MVPVRYFVISSLKFVSCIALTGAIVVGFAFTYSYLGGSRLDRAEMNATFAHYLGR